MSKESYPLIYSKMIAINRNIEAIGKNEVNQMQRFNFRGIDTVYNEVHDIMANEGVFNVPEVIEDRTEERKSKSGGALIYRILKMRYTFFAEDGSSVQAVVIGEGMDSGDKASNKAMAIAHKYALLQAFCIPTSDTKDPDAESHEVQSKDEQQKPAPSQSKPKPAGQSRSGPVFRFGKHKGEPLVGAKKDNLEWYRGAISKGINDPEKERYREDALLHLREIDDAITVYEEHATDAQRDHVQQDFEDLPPHEDDDMPF
jgi:hypothetical protein